MSYLLVKIDLSPLGIPHFQFKKENPLQTRVVPARAKLNGISGGPDRRFATINNVVFETGERGVIKIAGQPVSIHCLAITETNAAVQVGNSEQTQILTLQ